VRRRGGSLRLTLCAHTWSPCHTVCPSAYFTRLAGSAAACGGTVRRRSSAGDDPRTPRARARPRRPGRVYTGTNGGGHAHTVIACYASMKRRIASSRGSNPLLSKPDRAGAIVHRGDGAAQPAPCWCVMVQSFQASRAPAATRRTKPLRSTREEAHGRPGASTPCRCCQG